MNLAKGFDLILSEYDKINKKIEEDDNYISKKELLQFLKKTRFVIEVIKELLSDSEVTK